MHKIKTTSMVSDNIKDNPLLLHISPIGLFRMGSSNKERFNKFHSFLNDVKYSGGNIAIPVYSYSYTKNKVFDVNNTPSSLESVSEYLRNKNKNKRTVDPNFSYLLFGNSFSNRHLEVGECSTFGVNSLIDDVFIQDGYLGAVGGALEYLTEIHYIERKLNVDYRVDKIFNGITIDRHGKKNNTSSVFYCRDLELDYFVSLVQLKNDLIKAGLVEEWVINEYKLKIEVLKFKSAYEFIKNKLPNNPRYLWK